MQRLSQIEAGKLLNKAWSDVHKYTLGSYRFGQSLFNVLPNDICNHIVGTDMDFYYQSNDELATKMFYDHCVTVEETKDE